MPHGESLWIHSLFTSSSTNQPTNQPTNQNRFTKCQVISKLKEPKKLLTALMLQQTTMWKILLQQKYFEGQMPNRQCRSSQTLCYSITSSLLLVISPGDFVVQLWLRRQIRKCDNACRTEQLGVSPSCATRLPNRALLYSVRQSPWQRGKQRMFTKNYRKLP